MDIQDTDKTLPDTMSTFFFGGEEDQASSSGISSENSSNSSMERVIKTTDNKSASPNKSSQKPPSQTPTKQNPTFESRSLFTATQEGEVNMVEGEIVTLLETSGLGWWLVQTHAGLGWVPSHYLKAYGGHGCKSTEKNISEQVLPRDVFAPRIYMHEKENEKPKGHVANRFLQSQDLFPKDETNNMIKKDVKSTQNTKEKTIANADVAKDHARPEMKSRDVIKPKLPAKPPSFEKKMDFSRSKSLDLEYTSEKQENERKISAPQPTPSSVTPNEGTSAKYEQKKYTGDTIKANAKSVKKMMEVFNSQYL